MNDRFKFRAWSKQLERMVCIDEMLLFRLAEVDSDLVFEQCTGLKDKNGKLIYEGDIVKTKDGDILGIKWGKTGFNTPELFTSAGFIMSIRTSWGEDYMQFDKKESYYEVIGNIHENPELLEVEK